MMELEPGYLIGGRYEIIRPLGEGGYAQVYQVRDTRLSRTVAVKVQYATSPKFVERFSREARALANLSHPNIVRIHYFDCQANFCYIDMEYIEGVTLRDRIKSVAPSLLSFNEALNIAVQVASALEYAHQKGLIHRDIKPGNVLIDAHDGKVKVVDFGIARGSEDSPLTSTGMVLGTADYLSPEQAQGDPAAPQSDIYSLGVILYEMLTGQRPFTSDTVKGLLIKHITETPKRPSEINPGISPQLDAIVMRALEKDPAHRFASAGEMIQALQAYITSLPPEPQPVEAPRPEESSKHDAEVEAEAQAVNPMVSLGTQIAEGPKPTDKPVHPPRIIDVIRGSGESIGPDAPTQVAQLPGYLPQTRLAVEPTGPDAVTQIVQKSQPDAPTIVKKLPEPRKRVARRRITALVSILSGLGLLTAIGLFIMLRPPNTPGPPAIPTPSVTSIALGAQPSASITRTELHPLTRIPIPTYEVISAANAQRVSSGAFLEVDHYVLSVAFSPDGRYLALGTQDDTTPVYVWRINDLTLINALSTLKGTRAYGDSAPIVTFSSNGEFLAASILGVSTSGVEQWQRVTESGREHFRDFDSLYLATQVVEGFSPDLQTIALTDLFPVGDFRIYLYQGLGKDDTLKSILSHSGAVSDVIFSSDGQTLASASSNGTIRLWNIMEENKPLYTLEGHTNDVTALVFSPDGTTLAAASTDKTIKLWREGKLWHTFEGHENASNSLAFSPDGGILASGSTDMTVRLWDVENGILLETLEGHTGAILSVAFSPDGRIVASGSSDKTVRLWGISGVR